MQTALRPLALWTLLVVFVQASEPDTGVPVLARWEIVLWDDFTPKQYAEILDHFGIEIGVLGNNEVTYAKNLSSSQPDVYKRSSRDEKRGYWLSRGLATADREFFQRAGIAISDKPILHFWTEELQRRLLELERDYRGREVSDIRKTRFSVRREGDSYAFYVVDQEAGEPNSSAEFECRWTDGPIVIDGRADEKSWAKAQLIDHFSLPWLAEGARPAKTATKARLLWDRENLYFFAEMQDADLYADVTEHDGMTWDNDVFELFFKPADDKPGYYEFQVNAAGTIMDMFLPRRGSGGYRRFKSDGKFHIEAKVSLAGTLNQWQDQDTGWTVEGRIPWSDLSRTGGRPAEGEKWKFALCRYDYSVAFEGPELSTCAPLKSRPASFHNHEEYAAVRFVGPNK